MLVLSRRIGEAIVLPEDEVIIRVLNVRGDSIRLGIMAPTKVAVHREEVWQRILGASPPEEIIDCGIRDVPTLPR